MAIVYIPIDDSRVFNRTQTYTFFDLTTELKRWFYDHNITFGMYINFEEGHNADCYISYTGAHFWDCVSFSFKNITDALLFKLTWG